MPRIASPAAGLVVLMAALPASTPAAAPGPCAGAPALYTLAGQSPAAFRRDLAPTYYEVGLGGATYGPGPGLPVPWPRVAAWVRAHPVQDLTACGGAVHDATDFPPAGSYRVLLKRPFALDELVAAVASCLPGG